jgi:hypothetical protein
VRLRRGGVADLADLLPRDYCVTFVDQVFSLTQVIIPCDAYTILDEIAEVYAFRGGSAHAFEWLERAYSQRDGAGWFC